MRTSIERREERLTGEVVGGRGDWSRLRVHAARRLEETIDEIPSLVRKVKMLVIVSAISIPVFTIGVLVLLARAIR